MLPTIFTAFLYGLLFVPFPLVSCISCIFNIFFQEFYPSPSVSNRFCTISSGCYRIFLHFHCIFPACLLHRHSLFLQSLRFPPCSNRFCTLYSGCYHIFLPGCYHIFLHCIFPAFSMDFARFPLIVIMFSYSFYILFVGFQSIHAFLIYFSKIFTRLLFAPFPCIFNVFFQEFYSSPSFSDRFCTISSGCYRIFLHFHCLFPTCLFTASS